MKNTCFILVLALVVFGGCQSRNKLYDDILEDHWEVSDIDDVAMYEVLAGVERQRKGFVQVVRRNEDHLEYHVFTPGLKQIGFINENGEVYRFEEVFSDYDLVGHFGVPHGVAILLGFDGEFVTRSVSERKAMGAMADDSEPK